MFPTAVESETRMVFRENLVEEESKTFEYKMAKLSFALNNEKGKRQIVS